MLAVAAAVVKDCAFPIMEDIEPSVAVRVYRVYCRLRKMYRNMAIIEKSARTTSSLHSPDSSSSRGFAHLKDHTTEKAAAKVAYIPDVVYEAAPSSSLGGTTIAPSPETDGLYPVGADRSLNSCDPTMVNRSCSRKRAFSEMLKDGANVFWNLSQSCLTTRSGPLP